MCIPTLVFLWCSFCFMSHQAMIYQYVTGIEFQNGCLQCVDVSWLRCQ